MPGVKTWGQGDFDGSGAVNLSPDILPALENVELEVNFVEWTGGAALRGGSFASESSGAVEDAAMLRLLMKKHGIIEGGEVADRVTVAQWNEFIDEVFDVFNFDLATAA
jgi:hypothetical protein